MGNGRCSGSFVGEPRRTLCAELLGHDTVIPSEAWMIHGEERLEELDMGFPSERRHINTENVAEEDIYPNRDGLEEKSSQEEREAKRWDPKTMLQAAKKLLRLLYGVADDSISIFEFEAISKTNSIIILYLKERMDGVVKYFFYNLRDEYVVEKVLEFVQKMAPYKPVVSREEENHILPHARIERHEMNALRKKIQHAEISSQAKARLMARAQIEQGRSNTCHATKLGKALFGKDKFSRLLRATV